MSMKVIAFYLPQFHEIPENNEWWGQGFTEWTAVKQATALFEGHNQPRAPLGGDYYNLLEKPAMEKQAQLMKQYNVFGMCFYHYYFKDGRRVLEKPAENLLKWTDIDMPFCFSWANESWVHSWSAVKEGSFWAKKFDIKQTDGYSKNQFLLEQTYGDEYAWKEHFYYLLPFFKDSRYIKINNMPIFLIYRPELIPCLSEMVSCWQNLARKENIQGIYFIGAKQESRYSPSLNALYYHTPKNIFSNIVSSVKKGITVFNYDSAWDYILSEDSDEDSKTYFSGFVDFDTTPRHGSSGIIFENVSPKRFEYYFTRLLKKSEQCGNEYVFLNAWNEWGEGMYLEPDTKYGTQYLQAVSNALANYKTVDFVQPDKRDFEIKKKDSEISRLTSQVSRYKSFWTILDRWLLLKENGFSVSDYFVSRGMTKVAIYGLGMLARHLAAQLKDTEVKIAYGIDRRGNSGDYDFPVYYPDDELPPADAVIVTTVYDFDAVRDALSKDSNVKILSLEEVVGNCVWEAEV